MKRKNLLQTGIALMTVPFFFTACQKESKTDEATSVGEDVIVSNRDQEENMAEEFYAGTDCNYDWSQLCGTCATITQSSTDYPKTVTIDYGDGCEGPHGHVKKGKIILEISDNLHNEGAVRTMTYDNFFIDDVQITGSRTATNIGLNGNSNLVITVTGTMTAIRDGVSRTRTVNHEREWIAGSETCEREDDEFLITGTGTVEGPHGTATTTIETPLYVAPGQCNYIMSGSIHIEGQGSKHRGGTIDFGDGTCHNIATMTTNSGKTFDIDLDQRKIMH